MHMNLDWDEDYLTLPPAGPGEPRYWGAHPADELAYETFIRYSLSAASFTTGVTITSAVLDWTSAAEDRPVLAGEEPGGWSDPDCLDVGGVSRVCDDRDETLQVAPAHVRLLARQFSFLTLDAPTWSERREERDSTLYTRLIKPLTELEERRPNDLYAWLDRICDFCAGKPLVYLARYRPSAAIAGIARSHNVALYPLPLVDLGEGPLARNQRFRLMQLDLNQWSELERRLRGRGEIEQADLLSRHREGA